MGQTSLNFVFPTKNGLPKMVFPKTIKSMNLGSELAVLLIKVQISMCLCQFQVEAPVRKVEHNWSNWLYLAAAICLSPLEKYIIFPVVMVFL